MIFFFFYFELERNFAGDYRRQLATTFSTIQSLSRAPISVALSCSCSHGPLPHFAATIHLNDTDGGESQINFLSMCNRVTTSLGTQLRECGRCRRFCTERGRDSGLNTNRLWVTSDSAEFSKKSRNNESEMARLEHRRDSQNFVKLTYTARRCR